MRTPPYRDVTVGRLLTELAAALPGPRGAVVRRRAALHVRGTRARSVDDRARLIAEGVEPGERVVLWATNVPEWIVLQFALAKIGAILVTANTALRARDIDYLVRQSEAATVVTIAGFRDVDYVGALREIGADCGRNSDVAAPAVLHRPGSAAADSRTTRRFASAPRKVPDAELEARSEAVGVDDVINMQYTSGTTGFPEGRDALEPQYRQQRRGPRRRNRATAGRPAVPVRPVVPLFRLRDRRARRLHARRLSVPDRGLRAEARLETVHRERCTALYGVPTMFLAELEHPDFRAVRPDVAQDRRDGRLALSRSR